MRFFSFEEKIEERRDEKERGNVVYFVGRYSRVPLQEEEPPALPERNGQELSTSPKNNLATQKLHEILATPRKPPRSRSEERTLSPKRQHSFNQTGTPQRRALTPAGSPTGTTFNSKSLFKEYPLLFFLKKILNQILKFRKCRSNVQPYSFHAAWNSAKSYVHRGASHFNPEQRAIRTKMPTIIGKPVPPTGCLPGQQLWKATLHWNSSGRPCDDGSW